MTPPDVQRVFAERRRRVARIRRQVTAVAVALFLALWGVVFFQLVSGHDPALAAKAGVATTSTSTTASTPATTSTSNTTATTPATTSSSHSTSTTAATTNTASTSSSSSSSTPLTTSQS